MAVSLDRGIEGISYQAEGAGFQSDFPRNKAHLPVSASIPSHLEEVFKLYNNAHTLENALAPKVANKYVTSPSSYSRLFEELREIAGRRTPESDSARQAVQAAQALLDSMKEDFQAFNIGRSTLIQG